MELVRIGEKIISLAQIDRWISRIFSLRQDGLSQQEVAQKLKIDRSFVSRLENLGEIRKGRSVAVLGFPVGNGAELEALCVEYGVDWWLFFSEDERLNFVDAKRGIDLFNKTLEIISTIRDYDTVVVAASNKRVQLVERLLDRDVVAIDLGPSPLTEDIKVDEEAFAKILHILCGEERRNEKKADS